MNKYNLFNLAFTYTYLLVIMYNNIRIFYVSDLKMDKQNPVNNDHLLCVNVSSVKPIQCV